MFPNNYNINGIFKPLNEYTGLQEIYTDGSFKLFWEFVYNCATFIGYRMQSFKNVYKMYKHTSVLAH